MNIKKTISLLLLLVLICGTLCGCGKSESRQTQNIEVNDEIVVVSVVDMTLADAEKTLQNVGFTNIASNVDSNADKSEWIVTDQNVEGGQSIHPEDVIKLTCALKCKLFIDVTSEGNLIFNKYDIIINLDDVELGSASNGSEFTHLANILSGKHELTFCKAGDESVKSTRTITVSGNMTYTCDLAHDSKSIDIKNEEIIEGVREAELEVVDVTGMVLSEAIEKLKNIGFSNIREEPYSSIWDKDNWIVMEQNITAGTIMSKADYIQLDCISLDDYFNETYTGKNVDEIQQLADASGFTILFYDEEGKDISADIKELEQTVKADWIASKARQYGGADKSAVVTIKNIAIVEESKDQVQQEDTPDKPEETNNEVKEVNEKSEKENENIEMPIMAGTSIDIVTSAAEDYGLVQKYTDEDFEHGTKMRPLSSSNDGLMIDIIYSVETEEILCANITTLNGFSSADEQEDFVIYMSEFICPESDKDEVTEWVKSNVGNTEEITVSGIVYELGLGPVGNVLYHAGNRNWEEWWLSTY